MNNAPQSPLGHKKPSKEELEESLRRAEKIKKRDLLANKSITTPYNSKGTQEFDYHAYEDYMDVNEINLNDLEQTNKLRAQRQSTGEQLYRTLGNFVGNTAVGIVHDVGALGLLATQWGDNRTYSNAITRWAEENRNPFGEVYSESPDGYGWDTGSILNTVSGAIQPLAQFALEGMALGAALKPLTALGESAGLLANSEKLANIIGSESKIISGLGKAAQSGLNVSAKALETFVPQTLNSAGIGYFASVDGAARTYEVMYEYARNTLEFDDAQARKFASQQAHMASVGVIASMISINFAMLNPAYMSKGVQGEVLNMFKKQEAEMLSKGLLEGEGKSYASRLKGALGELTPESGALKEYMKGGNNLTKNIATGVKAGAQFGFMDLAHSESTLKNTESYYDKILNNKGKVTPKDVSPLGSFTSAMTKTLDEIMKGNDPDGAKKLAMSFITGVAVHLGHKFVNNRFKRTNSYSYDEDGKLISINNEKGEPTGDFESTKMSNYRANKANRDRVFKAYRNSLIKDLDKIEEANIKLDKLSKSANPEKEAYTYDEIFDDLFDLQAYNMVTMGGKKFIENSLREIAEIDNETNLGDAVLEKRKVVKQALDEIERMPLQDQTDEVLTRKEQLLQEDEKLKEEFRKVNGTTEAMQKGYASEMADGSNNATANDYRTRVQQSMKDLDYLDSKWKEYNKLYGFGKKRDLELPQYLMQFETAKLAAQRKIDRLQDLFKVKEGENFDKANGAMEYMKAKYSLDIIDNELASKLPILLSKKGRLENGRIVGVKDYRFKETQKDANLLLAEKERINKSLEESDYHNSLAAMEENLESLTTTVNELSAEKMDITNQLNKEGNKIITGGKEYNEKIALLDKQKNKLESLINEKKNIVGKLLKEDARTAEYKNLIKKIPTLTDDIIKAAKDHRESYREAAKLKEKISVAENMKANLDASELKAIEVLGEKTAKLKALNDVAKTYTDELGIMGDKLKGDKDFIKYNEAIMNKAMNSNYLNYLKTNKGIEDYLSNREKELEEGKKSIEKESEKLKSINNKKRTSKWRRLIDKANDAIKRKTTKEEVVKEEKRVKEEEKVKKAEEEKAKDTNKSKKENIDKKQPSPESGDVEDKKSEKQPSNKPEEEQSSGQKAEKTDSEIAKDAEKEVVKKEHKEVQDIPDVPEKNGVTAKDNLNPNDPNFGNKKIIAVSTAEDSNTIREVAAKIESNKLKAGATYIDDLAHLITAQYRVSDTDLMTSKWINEIADELKNLTNVLDLDQFKAINSKLLEKARVLDMDIPQTTDLLTHEYTNPESYIATIFDTITSLRNEYNKDAEIKKNNVRLMSFSSYESKGYTPEKILELAKATSDNNYEFLDPRTGDRNANAISNITMDLTEALSNMRMANRLSDVDPKQEFMNMAEFLVSSIKVAHDIKKGSGYELSGEDKQALDNTFNVLKSIYESEITLRTGEVESLNDFRITNDYEIKNVTIDDLTDDITNFNTNPIPEEVDKANRILADLRFKRVEGAVISNDSTGFDRILGTQDKLVTKALKKESNISFKMGDAVTFEHDTKFNGEVNYFDGKKYRKIKWNDLKKEKQDSLSKEEYDEWLIQHSPIKINHNGETVGYVPMLSSINEHTIASNDKIDYLPEAIKDVKDLRNSINEGNMNAEVSYKSSGMLNTTDTFNRVSTYSPEIVKRSNSMGIIKEDGIYIGDKKVKNFNVKEAKAYKSLIGNTVLTFKGSNGATVNYLVYRGKLDGSTHLNPDMVVSKEHSSTDNVIQAMGRILDNKKGTPVDNLYKALRNTVKIESIKESDISDADYLLSRIGSDNAGVIAVKNKDNKTTKFLIGNQEMETLSISNSKDVEINRGALTEAFNKVNHVVNNDSLGKDVPVLKSSDKEGVTYEVKPYNEYLGDKLISRLVEKKFKLPADYKHTEGDMVVKGEEGYSELLYTNNSVAAIESINNKSSDKVRSESETKKEVVPKTETEKEIKATEERIKEKKVAVPEDVKAKIAKLEAKRKKVNAEEGDVEFNDKTSLDDLALDVKTVDNIKQDKIC